MDNSFLRLTRSFGEAVSNENFAISKILENRFIQMLPGELFLQITNCEEDIAFAGNIKVELVNEYQEVLKDITLFFFYKEFTDINGIKQIAFEFGKIGIDFGTEELYLKISHTVSDKIWYSAPFIITDEYKEETTRFDYKHASYFKGISYDRANYFQSVRLSSFENDIDIKEELTEYTQTSGNSVSMRKIVTQISKGVFKFCNNFTFKRSVVLFSHDIIYINKYRSSNKPGLKKSDRLGTSNFFDLGYEWCPTEEYRDPVPQINVVICNLYIHDVLPDEDQGFITVNWTNSADPFNVLIEISLNNQLTWNKPDNLVLNNSKDSAIYTSPGEEHYIKLTPLCNANSVGFPIVVSFKKTGDYNSKDYNPKDYKIRKL